MAMPGLRRSCVVDRESGAGHPGTSQDQQQHGRELFAYVWFHQAFSVWDKSRETPSCASAAILRYRVKPTSPIRNQSRYFRTATGTVTRTDYQLLLNCRKLRPEDAIGRYRAKDEVSSAFLFAVSSTTWRELDSLTLARVAASDKF